MRDDSAKTSPYTRSRILDAAEVLFMEHGFDGTSMRMITGSAGVNLAAVNYHFGTKELLIQEVFRRRLTDLNNARVAVLDRMEAEAGGAPLKPSRIVDAFFGTALRMDASDAPRMSQAPMVSHTARPWRRMMRFFASMSAQSGTGSPVTAASIGQKRFCGWP